MKPDSVQLEVEQSTLTMVRSVVLWIGCMFHTPVIGTQHDKLLVLLAAAMFDNVEYFLKLGIKILNEQNRITLLRLSASLLADRKAEFPPLVLSCLSLE